MFKILSKLNKFNKKCNLRAVSHAFTIVELLVVIVVIGILASITAVSYSGVTQKAKDASLKADLRNVATILELDKAASPTNSYPTTLGDANGGKGITMSSGNTFDYSYSPGSNTYTLTASKANTNYYITSSNTTPTPGLAPTSFVLAWGNDSDEEAGNSIASTSDGGFVITGGVYSDSTGYYDMFISKYTSSGTLSWDNTWGGSDDDGGSSVVQTSDGGYAVTGYTYSYGAGSYDVIINKYTSDGTLSWSKTWGGTGNDRGHSIAAASDGGYVITGETNSYGAGLTDMFINKYTSDGTLSWSKTWGGTSQDYGKSIIATNDGGYMVGGMTGSYGAGNYDMLIAKYTSDGTLSWSKTWGGTNVDKGYSIAVTADGGYIITGETSSYGTGSSDMFIAKYTSDGTLSWSKTWGGTGSDIGYSVAATTDRGYVVTGYTISYGAGAGDMFIAKYTSDGTLSWSKTWGGDIYDAGYSITATSNGSYVTTGQTYSYIEGSADIFIAKYLADGTITNCSAPMCQTPSVTVTTPSAATSAPTATVTSPSATTANQPIATTIPSATTTVIVAP